MQRAIELAARGLGEVAPNPLVGCVIEHNGQVIGEGWHRKFGEAHAEVNAIRSCENHELLKEATLYVTLEPCAHFGKTPPCSSLIVASGIPRVVVATPDPNPLVAGKGIAELKQAGVEVIERVLEREARHINRRFLINQHFNRPYIILKWAQSADGYMDIDRTTNEKGSYRISGDSARRLLHRWRAEESAILVGVNTVLVDNPELTCRYWKGGNPVRVVLDLHAKLTGNEAVFNNQAKTIHCTAEWLDLNLSQLSGSRLLTVLMPKLLEQKISSILVEGGRQTLDYFLESGIWDEIRIFSSSNNLHYGLKAPEFSLPFDEQIQLEDDLLTVCYNPSIRSL